ncbi:hypothetical protein B296_00026704 [Ensete ventricosum]|uniref:Uncharacterized protein n=1 Tax=Ensete ventricosum TaxID=4639 RepID=A0A426YG95_ENSVE|nr:hypothetical protein B296_00026704 [Ensete ventricosum]
MVSKSSSREHVDADHDISALADHPMSLNKQGGDGTRIVVLASENKGAVTKVNSQEMMDTGGVLRADKNALAACANSNYQAINNSIVLDGSCTAEDPGIHIAISDHEDDDDESGEGRI